MPSVGDRCSLRSLAVEEPLAGTASTIRHWLLIEHPGPWGRDGLLDARLPAGVGRDLRTLERRTGARVLLIRKTRRTDAVPDGPFMCFAIDTRDAWMGFQEFGRIEDAPAFDPRDRDAYFDPEGEPLFVICTHGRRDPCCAERGRPLAEAAAAVGWDTTWESTHVGGDRFAGNLVAFPHGLYFGRVEPGEVDGLMRAYDAGRIEPLPRYRGRSSHQFHVQVAERSLRERLGLDGVDAVTPHRADRDGGRAEVEFATERGPHRVRLERVLGPPMRLTCHASNEEAPPTWRTLEIEPLGD